MNTVDPCGCIRPHSRREFVKAIGALGALGAMGAIGALSGCASLASAGPRRLVDTHHHFFPESYAKAWVEWQTRNKLPVSLQPGWSPARAIEVMDKGGVATSILSLASTPGTWFDTGAAEADRMARLCNDYGANMVRDHPGRFGLLATLPMLTIDSTLREIAYAFDTLKADGVGLQTNYGPRYPGDAFFRPVWEELNRRKALVHLHPLAAQCCVPAGITASSSIIEYPTDTTSAVLSLLVSGTLVRHRGRDFRRGAGDVQFPFQRGAERAHRQAARARLLGHETIRGAAGGAHHRGSGGAGIRI